MWFPPWMACCIATGKRGTCNPLDSVAQLELRKTGSEGRALIRSGIGGHLLGNKADGLRVEHRAGQGGEALVQQGLQLRRGVGGEGDQLRLARQRLQPRQHSRRQVYRVGYAHQHQAAPLQLHTHPQCFPQTLINCSAPCRFQHYRHFARRSCYISQSPHAYRGLAPLSFPKYCRNVTHAADHTHK